MYAHARCMSGSVRDDDFFYVKYVHKLKDVLVSSDHTPVRACCKSLRLVLHNTDLRTGSPAVCLILCET